MKTYNRKLLVDLGTMIVVLFILAILINSYSIFYGSSYRFQKRQLRTAQYILGGLGNSFDENNKTGYGVPFRWYVDFWHEHYSDMELDKCSEEELLQRSKEIRERFGDGNMMELTEEDIKKLSYDDQLILAKMNYLANNYIYNLDLANNGMEVEDYTLCSFILTDDDKGFMIFKNDPEYTLRRRNDPETDPPSYYLGRIIDFDLDDHPMAKKALETGEFQETPETSFSFMDRKVTLNYYLPITEVSGRKALVQLSLDWTSNIKARWRDAVQIEVVNFIVLFIAAAMILIMVYFAAVRPLSKIQQNVMDYKESKDSERIVKNTAKLRSQNEFGALAEDIASLAVEMNRYIDEVSRLSGDRERKKAELSIAMAIQKQNLPDIFPAFPDRKDFDLFASMIPAQEVGGDFYDYFLIDEDHLALVIADVSGKGVPAALFMMMAKTRLNSIALSERLLDPAKILNETNKILAENNDTAMFVTVWLGILTISTGELLTANAGHDDPYIFTDGSFSHMEEKHGLVLGLMPDSEYEVNRLTLKKGDAVFVCTDGVTEAFDDKDVQFGPERIMDILNKNKNESLEDILFAMKTAVFDHSKTDGAFDDITMLAARLTADENKSQENE